MVRAHKVTARWATKMHGRCDTNKDGKVTWDEYRTCQRRGSTARDAASGQGDARRARNPAQAQAMFERSIPAKKGVVTREQYQTWLHKRFDGLDANHDGVLTPD